MLETDIVTQPTIVTTVPAPGDPTYQTETLALFLKQQFEALRIEGFQFKAPEASDFTTFNAETLTGVDNFETRLDEILSTGVSTVVATLPDVTPIIVALLAGGGGAVIPILLKGVLDVMLRHMNSRTTAAGGDFSGDVDTSGIEEKLDDIKDQIEATLNEFTINLFSDASDSTVKYGQIDES